MQIAAHLGFSSPSKFYNTGGRHNNGVPGVEGEFVETGHIIGAVGARFEKPGLMEHRHLVVTDQERNTPLDKIWAEHYGLDTFPTHVDAISDTSGRFVPLPDGNHLDMQVYKAIMKPRLQAIMDEANAKGTPDKPAYVHLVGLGTGVWSNCNGKNCEEIFAKVQLELYKEIVQAGDYTNVADLDFSHFFGRGKNILPPDSVQDINGKTLNIHYSENDPGAKSNADGDLGKKDKTLVTLFAWDGGSFPGNELFSDNLHGSGDPAAALFSDVVLAYAAQFANDTSQQL